jgi:hypothetical protein
VVQQVILVSCWIGFLLRFAFSTTIKSSCYFQGARVKRAPLIEAGGLLIEKTKVKVTGKVLRLKCVPILTQSLNVFLVPIPNHKYLCFTINNRQCLNLSQITAVFVKTLFSHLLKIKILHFEQTESQIFGEYCRYFVHK